MNRSISYFFIVCCISILFSCQKELSVDLNPSLTASGSLWDSTGVCLPDSVHGTFYDGIVPGSDTAYVEIQVNVTQTGSYNISSDLQDGFLFADSGFFSTTGINTIRLKPIGAPIIPTTATFSINFDSSFCSFSVTIQDSTGTGLGGQKDTADSNTWQFATDSGGFSQGTFANVIFQPDSISGTDLIMAGYTPNGDSIINLVVIFPGDTIAPGTYYTQITGNNTRSNAIFAFGLASTGNSIYDALDNPQDSSLVGITISSYNSLTHIVTGTFSGKAIDEAYYPATIGILNGSFAATVP